MLMLEQIFLCEAYGFCLSQLLRDVDQEPEVAAIVSGFEKQNELIQDGLTRLSQELCDALTAERKQSDIAHKGSNRPSG